MEEAAPKLTWKGRLIATFVGLLLLLVISEGALRVGMPHWRDFYSGWFMRTILVANHGIVATGQPGFDGYFAQNNGDFRVHIKINDFGLRNPEPIENSDKRTWIVGDSMAFGWGVEQDEMYSSILGKKLGSKTYNVASPGTSVCGYQALLSRMPKDLVPSAVVIGLILENDMTVYDCTGKAREQETQQAAGKISNDGPVTWIGVKRYLTGKSALYNFAAVGLKRINFIRDFFTNIGLIRKTISYKGFISDDKFKSVVTTTADELEVLKRMIPENTPFLVLVAPGRFELLSDDNFYKRLRLSVISELKKRNIAVVDPFNRFKEAGYQNIHFAHDGHWSALGHKIAAEELSKVLKPQLLKN
jgi:hypothetical protein